MSSQTIPIKTILLNELRFVVLFFLVLQISDIHQFYTRNVEVHTMDDMDFIMSSVSSSRANRISGNSRKKTAWLMMVQPAVTTVIGSLTATMLFVRSLIATRAAEQPDSFTLH